MLQRSVWALAGGFALSAAFEPIGLAVLMPPAVAVWVLTVRGLAPGRAWLPSLLFGASFCFTLMTWMQAVGTDGWIGLSALEAAFFIPLGVVTALLVRLPAWPLWVTAAWVGVEAIRSSWPESGMPWGRLGFATAGTVWQPALPYAGMAGVSALVALTGCTLAWLVTDGRRTLRTAVPVVVALGLLTALPPVAPFGPHGDDEATVAVVQPDVPGAGDDLLAVFREVTRSVAEATVGYAEDVAAGEAPGADLVVWPENSTAVDPARDEQTAAAIARASAAVGRPILVGAIVDGPGEGQVSNQGVVWTPEEGPEDRYDKRHPVPFGEYIPWRPLMERLGIANLGRLREIPRDMIPGRRREPLRAGDLLVADAICFDVAYEDGLYDQVARGANLVAVQTSNAFYVFTHQLDQQFEITRLRAVETGRAVVVASTNGISAIVLPDGTVADSAPRRTTEVLVDTVPLSTTLTPAVRMGLWPGRVAVLVALLAALWSTLRSRRGRQYRRHDAAERGRAVAQAGVT